MKKIVSILFCFIFSIVLLGCSNTTNRDSQTYKSDVTYKMLKSSPNDHLNEKLEFKGTIKSSTGEISLEDREELKKSLGEELYKKLYEDSKDISIGLQINNSNDIVIGRINKENINIDKLVGKNVIIKGTFIGMNESEDVKMNLDIIELN